ncbi:MAG: TlpA family protein disulfide reductase [Planctomycetes bacterium]|nr:TlpA family protein disulfide reductase [Planctomycetota bacterium]MCG2684690.1 TlpA family protein disulfide reductase [Planctomycetales bacterium]
MRSLVNGTVLALMLLMFTCTSLFAEPAAPDKPADKPDPYAVPEGSTQDLVDFLSKLAKVKPANAEEGKKMQAALIKAADGILAAEPDEKQLALAVGAKSQALGDNLDELAEFAAQLKKDGHAKFAHNVRGFALGRKLQLAPLTQETIKERTTEIVNFLSEDTVDAGMDAQLAKLAGRMAEMSGDGQFAADTYRKLQKIFTGSTDPRAVRIGKAMEGLVRRMSLVGHPMTIEGAILGGGPFDWSKYQGKVVLVNFFATWCASCRREIKKIKKSYDLYHDKGFDVVGISCDRNQTMLEKFVKDKKLPWPIVYGDKKPSPTVAYYGIEGLPQLILVGKDGKVITLDAHGDRLLKELEKLLGPAEEKAPPGSDA